MKQSKQSLLMHIWEQYEFYLNIPHNFDGTNKPFIYYYYEDNLSKVKTRIRRYIPKHDGNLKLIKSAAKLVILETVELLSGNWNPCTKLYNEISISPLSTVEDCIAYWIGHNERAFANKAIGKTRLKNIKIGMAHFKDWLTKSNNLTQRVSNLNNIHVKDFLDSKANERHWGKVSYNCYRLDLGTFFNFLLDSKVVKDNPVKRVSWKTTKFDSTRFQIFEMQELTEVANLLANDKAFFNLYVASKLLFRCNIRPLEIIRLQVCDIDLSRQILVLPPEKTKNGNEARYLLDDEICQLLSQLIDDADTHSYIFCRRNKTTSEQTFDDYLGQRWRAFRYKYKLPKHLKFYALKHSSNYYDIENGASYEEIRQRNRHANLQITTLYIRERLFKNTIKPSSSKAF